MYHDTSDTIAAIATSAGGAARGMVRVSGARMLEVVESCFSHEGRSLREANSPVAVLGRVSVPLDGRLLEAECDLYLWPTARSFTRQPMAELHTLGSRPLLQAVLDAVCRAGARLAEPGEFTLRAFLAGRIDLTQAEAVLGVIDARTPDQLDAALAQLAGGLAHPLHQLRSDMLQLLAELEAGLDFADENLEFVSRCEIVDRLSVALARLDHVSAQMSGRMNSHCLPQVVLIGRPNIGKSSLFNSLLARGGVSQLHGGRRNVSALVSPVGGTTRDYLTGELRLDGFSCELFDTAGIESDHVDAIGTAAQKLSAERGLRATIRLWCVDARESAKLPDVVRIDPTRDILVFTKADQVPDASAVQCDSSHGMPTIATSSLTGAGIEQLCIAIYRLLSASAENRYSAVIAATAERCRESIRLAAESIERAGEAAVADAGDELVAAELRVALDELGRVVGAVYTDDLLDRIFSTFCIGK
jgi:tRNA modification GTPase